MGVTGMKRWAAIGALAAAGVVLVGCGSGSSADMKDVVTDDRAALALIEKGLAGEETVKCVVKDDGDDVTLHIGSERRIQSTVKENGDDVSALFVGDEMYMWVEGEDAGFTVSGAEVDVQRAAIVEEMKTELRSIDLTSGDAGGRGDAGDFGCGVYTGGDDAFTAPSSVDFISLESASDLLKLEESAPKLVEILNS